MNNKSHDQELFISREDVKPSDISNHTISERKNRELTILTVPELKDEIDNKSLQEIVFSYNRALMGVSDFDTISQPFKSALALRGLSRNGCYFVEESGRQVDVSVPLLGKLAARYAVDVVRHPLVIRRHRNRVKELQAATSGRSTSTVDLSKSPLYMRTDLWAGVKTGGSVAHTAGVLNNLGSFGGSPCFFSSVEVPTVDPGIEYLPIDQPSAFADFPEVRPTYFNEEIIETGKQRFNSENLSFVYQRYAKYNYSGVALSQHFDVPLVLEYNGSEVWINENWGDGLRYPDLAESVEQLNVLAADDIVVVSEALVDELIDRGVDSDKILVNPNGVDPEMYSPDIDGTSVREEQDLTGKIVIGFIGTFGPWHGAEVLAEAFGKLLRDNPEYEDGVQLLLIGNGPRMSDVKNIIADNDIEGQTRYTGLVPQEEGPEYLAACDILASPHVPNPDGSDFFGSPTKLFEYMAMGKGIVASDLAQIGDVLDHERTALLAEPADADDLATKLTRLIEDDNLRSSLGNAARQDVLNNYTWKRHTERIVDKIVDQCNGS